MKVLFLRNRKSTAMTLGPLFLVGSDCPSQLWQLWQLWHLKGLTRAAGAAPCPPQSVGGHSHRSWSKETREHTKVGNNYYLVLLPGVFSEQALPKWKYSWFTVCISACFTHTCLILFAPISANISQLSQFRCLDTALTARKSAGIGWCCSTSHPIRIESRLFWNPWNDAKRFNGAAAFDPKKWLMLTQLCSAEPVKDWSTCCTR